MAIKHGSISVSAVKHGSVTVSQVDHGNINVFYLYYAVTVSAGTGVLRVFLSTNSQATLGYASGTKFKKGTTVYAFAALNTAGYSAPSNWSYIGNGNIYRVGSATVNSAYNFGTINAETASGPCTVKCSSNLIGLQNVYLSTSPEATFGSSSLSVAPGKTVYGFAVLGTDTYASKVNNWTLVSGTACEQGAIYRVGSKTPTSSGTTTTTFNIELFGSHLDTATVLFTRSGEEVGSWSIYNHMLQFAEDQCRIYTSGNSIYANGDDYSGSSITAKLATFNCPAGYTVTYTLKNSAGSSVAWNTWSFFDGPYTIDAYTEEEEDTTTT